MKLKSLTIPQILQKLNQKVTLSNVERIKEIKDYENKYTLVQMTSTNPTSKKGEYTYLYMIDNTGEVLTGFNEVGHPNWTQRFKDGVLVNKHLNISNTYPKNKRKELINDMRKIFGNNLSVRFQDTTEGLNWNLNDVESVNS
jgi:hypothetical protein